MPEKQLRVSYLRHVAKDDPHSKIAMIPKADLRALVQVVEAAHNELPDHDDHAHCAHPNTRQALARFDFTT